MSSSSSSDDNIPLVLRVLANAASAVDRACAIAREVLSAGQMEFVDKTGAYDPQTKADRMSQDCILNSLRTTFPGAYVFASSMEKHI